MSILNNGELKKLWNHRPSLVGFKMDEWYRARHAEWNLKFESKLDEAKKELEDWMDSEPTMDSGCVLQARTEQRGNYYVSLYTDWVDEGKELIKKWLCSISQ